MRIPGWIRMTVLFILLGLFYFGVALMSSSCSNGAVHKDILIRKECKDKGGIMIDRTYICVDKKSTIELENLK
jgi:hypothetical protein